MCTVADIVINRNSKSERTLRRQEFQTKEHQEGETKTKEEVQVRNQSKKKKKKKKCNKRGEHSAAEVQLG